MKKLFAVLLLTLSVTGICAHAESSFGELTYKADDGLYLFSEGGSTACDSFGFAFTGEKAVVHVYMTGCDFDKPYCAVFRNLPEGELEVMQFFCAGGSFVYDEPVYVLVQGDVLTVETLAQKKEEQFTAINESVEKALYREEERIIIDKILTVTKNQIMTAKSLKEINSAVISANQELAELKTDAQYYAEELVALKAEKISDISGYLDKLLYREAEQLKIDETVLSFTEKINSSEKKEDVTDAATEAKSILDKIPTDAKCKENAALNEEVIGYLDDTISELNGISSLSTKGKILRNKIIPVIKSVIDDGNYGKYYITKENIKGAYPNQIQDAKDYYYNPTNDETKMSEKDRTIFYNKVSEISPTVLAFLEEYFLG